LELSSTSTSILSKLFSGKQKSWTTFLDGREDDETIPRQSTFKNPLKVKAKHNSKSFRFPHTRLLLGLYDYRFKHLAIMEQEDCDVITTFQTDGLAQLFGSEKLESRTTPFQEGEDDMTTPASKMSQAPSQATTTQVLPIPTPAQVIDGPVTRSRAKKLQQEAHALLCEIHFNVNENYILPTVTRSQFGNPFRGVLSHCLPSETLFRFHTYLGGLFLV